MILPENSEYFPAWGAAMNNKEESNAQEINKLIEKLEAKDCNHQEEYLPALFDSEEAYHLWKQSRKIKRLKQAEFRNREHIDCFLGIDSGSTTTKILMMDE
ncbi:MAG: hypothetical protein QM727_01290 [Niabella sp.]